jgi:hypothetical protein
MPYIQVHIDIEDFDEDDIVEHLEGCGYTVTKNATGLAGYSSGYTLGEFELNHIEHLITCGLTDFAKEEALGFVCKAIGRSVAPKGWVTA